MLYLACLHATITTHPPPLALEVVQLLPDGRRAEEGDCRSGRRRVWRGEWRDTTRALHSRLSSCHSMLTESFLTYLFLPSLLPISFPFFTRLFARHTVYKITCVGSSSAHFFLPFPPAFLSQSTLMAHRWSFPSSWS